MNFMRMQHAFLGIVFALCGCQAVTPGEDESVGPRELVAADGNTVHYEVAGGGRPPLVLLPGWANDRSIWARQFEMLARSHRVVAIDLVPPGAGRGDRLEWSIEALGADVAEVVEKEELAGVVVIGHGLGAAVGLEAAMRAPGRIGAVIGVEAFHDVERSQRDEIAAFVTRLERDFAGTLRAGVPTTFGPKADPGVIGKVTERMAAADPAIAIALERSYGGYDFAGAFERSPAPVRAINARPTNVAANRRHSRDFNAVTLAGVGHFPMLEDPQNFDGVLVTVLSDLRIAPWVEPKSDADRTR